VIVAVAAAVAIIVEHYTVSQN